MTTLKSAVDERNQIQAHGLFWRRIILCILALLLALLMISLWSLVQPQGQFEQMLLGIVTFGLVLWLGRQPVSASHVNAVDLALALEIQYGRKIHAPLSSMNLDQKLSREWQEALAADAKLIRRDEIRARFAFASTLVIPVVLTLVTLAKAAPSLQIALREVSKVVERLHPNATLTVLQGGDDIVEKNFELAVNKPRTIELMAQNLIEIRVTGLGKDTITPVIELRRKQGGNEAAESVFQSFQMTPVHSSAADGTVAEHVISFAVSEDVELFITDLDRAHSLAHLRVRQLPVPKVKLQVLSQLENPWPDDQPLNLKIQVKAEHPLQSVHLLIKADQKQSKELVANILSEDKFELVTEYRVLLEPHVENDVAEVDIVAEAVDRALPTPLIGRSETIHLTVASAYGRYRRALQTLRELKSLVDGAAEKAPIKLPPEASTLVKKAVDESDRSPFFDGMDRLQIRRFDTGVDELMNNTDAGSLYELSQALNDFLFEHEILDDRERDRDFFVAARMLSHQLEAEPARRSVPLTTVVERLKVFLNGRHERWRLRVGRLKADLQPPEWNKIDGKRPFHQSLIAIASLDKKAPAAAAQSEQLTVLSKMVTDYRAWIQQLEAYEDKMREDEDRQRQQGLASAKDTLKELQKRQGEISSALDRASEKSSEQLSDQWPSARMKQNTNIKETRALEGQMRALSPTSAMRIQGALEAMEQVVEAGSAADYRSAEAGADLAGRLLRQAESAAQQSQQKRRSRGRRRRVTGDNYYGQSVVGGDVEIKREYQVDRRYREDILEEVQSSGYDEENRALLENYLRRVIR